MYVIKKKLLFNFDNPTTIQNVIKIMIVERINLFTLSNF